MSLDDDKEKKIGFNYAWQGLKHVFKLELNFRIHLLIGLLVMIAGIILKLTLNEWLAVILVIGLVLVSEMFNTVVETLLDYLNPAIHPTAKIIKDISAGAVLVSALIAVIIGFIIFIPKLFDMFS